MKQVEEGECRWAAEWRAGRQGRLWDRMAKHFDKVENESGNSEFDYDGKKTPEDKTDDCTLPGEGKAATDFAWKLKGAAMGKTQAILQKQLANADEMGEPEDLGGIIEQLWTGTYQKSRDEGGLREAIRKIIVDTILG